MLTKSALLSHSRHKPRSLVAIALAFLLAACGDSKTSAVSERGMEICRQRKADSAVGSSSESIRQAYRACLKSIDAELIEQTDQDNKQRRSESEAAQNALQSEQANQANQADRYSHCKQVREQVIEAEQLRIRTLGPAMVAARQFGEDSTEASNASAAYEDAVERLDQLIPDSMRAGRPLIPDSVKIFRRCEPGDFALQSE